MRGAAGRVPHSVHLELTFTFSLHISWPPLKDPFALVEACKLNHDLGGPQIGSCARFYLGDWYMESEELRQLLDFGECGAWHLSAA